MKRITRRILIPGAILLLILTFISSGIVRTELFDPQATANRLSCSEQVACPDCNVLLITIDSFRNDHIGHFGYSRDTTPELDRFIQTSTSFSNYFSTSYLTPITQMSIHTGMYPSSSGVVLFNSILPSGITTLGELLKSRGWSTTALHTAPEYFDEPGTKISFSRGFDWYQSLSNRDLSDFTSTYLMEELKQFSNRKSFLWLTVGSVHWPYGYRATNHFADPDYRGTFSGQLLRWELLTHVFGNRLYPGTIVNGRIDLESPASFDRLYVDTRNSGQPVDLTPDDLQYVTDMYDNGIRHFDTFFGKIISSLRAQGALDNTIVIITSEHGEDLHEHRYYAHYDIYDTLTHTPLIIYSPNLHEPMTVDGLISSVDILPTLMSLLGLPIPRQSQGIDFLPTLCGETSQDQRRSVFMERTPLWEQCVFRDAPIAAFSNYIMELEETGITPDIAIRTKDWKYIDRRTSDILRQVSWWKNLTGQDIPMPDAELYDVTADPMEQNNVASQHSDVAEDLQAQLDTWWGTIKRNQAEEPARRSVRVQEYF